MLESQACGTPVIAFAQGGALEVVNHIGVTNKPTGILFEDQSKESILKAIELFESGLVNIQPIHCLENAKRFSKETFKKSFKDFINQKIMFRSFKNKIENKKRA